MPGFEDVLHMRLEKLNEAVEDWERQVRAFESDSGMVGKATTMAQRARTVNWAGENSSVTLPYVTEQAEQFDAALTQARTLRELCRDAYTRLRSRQEALREVVEVEAPARGVHVRASGEVTADYEGLDDATRRERQDAVIEISAEIDRILTRAAEDDAVIAQALRDAMGTDPHRFTPVDYGSLNEAELAYQDAETVLRLMEQGGDLSDEQLAYVATLLGQHTDDPAFAERVAIGLSPQVTLDFWFGATSSRDIREGSEEWQRFADLQTNLGTVLGTATRSDSSAMERWEESLLTLGPDRVGGADGPYGFQVMSALMNAGEYDTDFLLAYGDKLLDFERADDRRASQLWDSDPFLPPLNFSTDRDEGGNLVDAGNIGHDPVTGFLNALSHNPEASAEFFTPPDGFDPTDDFQAPPDVFDADNENEQVNDRLNYLAREREWWNSVDNYGGPELIPVHASLGDALLAATTGISAEVFAAGDTETLLAIDDLRSQNTAGVMNQVMHLYGTADPGLLREQPAMAESLGTMASWYMDDINFWVSDGSETGRAGNAEIFQSSETDRAGNGHYSTIRFLTALAQNDVSHQAISRAEHLYTLSVLDANYPTDEAGFERGIEALNTAAEVRGIIDRAMVDQVNVDFADDADGAQRALGQSSGWWKALGGAAIGGGVGALSLVATGGNAAIAVPIATGAASPFVTEFLNQGVDGMRQAEVNREELRLDEAGFFGAGSSEVNELRDIYATMAEENGISVDFAYGAQLDMGRAYFAGQGYAENHGVATLPTEEP